MGIYSTRSATGSRRTDGQVPGGAPRDVSEFNRVEKELLSLLRQKEEEIQAQSGRFRAREMEAAGKLAGGVAHEFNNQLTVIYACVDLYLRGLSRDDTLRQSLLRIRKSAQVCADLTRQLLLFGGKIPLFKAPTDLNQVVVRLMQVLPYLMGARSARADAAVRFELETSPHLGVVNADAATIERAIINLVLNAREAMPGGGTLTIRTQDVSRRDRAGDAAPGRFACLSVSDTGAGIDEADMPHIFEPFFTTRGQGRGAGLGLSEAYGIIRAHNGWIEADSAPGQGSTFRFYLPALPPQA